MKYIGLLFITFILLTSCKNDQEELFEMTYEVDVIFEAGISTFQAHFIDSYGINTRIDELLAASGRTQEEISSILPKSAEIINLQTNVSLDFIRNLTLEVFEGTLFNPEIKENETEIFFRDNVPQDQSTFIDLLPSLPNVKDQLLEDNFNVSLRTELRVPPPNTVEARLRLRFTAQ